MIDAVKKIQGILKKAGLYSGAIDGLVGSKTYYSILSLNEDNSLKQIKREIQTVLSESRLYFGEIDGIFGGGSISAFNNLLPAPKITDSQLIKIQINCAVGFADQINKYAKDYNIKTKADLCAFIANIIHESNGFNSLRENMNYSTARLIKVFPKYFKSIASAREVVIKGQVAIADAVYGGRMGNGVDNGDGFKYRGGGLMHLTGKRNYTLASIGTGVESLLVEKPELIVEPEHAIKTAMWFWQGNRCSGHANTGKFDHVCRVVNGGTNGIEHRRELNQKAWNILH